MRASLLSLTLVAAASGPLLAAAPQPAQTGYLLIRAATARPGAQAARLFVYDAQGQRLSGPASGGWAAGDEAEVPPGDYWTEVADHPTGLRVTRLTVAAGKTTVVPTGWVSVATPHPDEQPTEGCSHWTARLDAVELAPDGKRVVIQSNLPAQPETSGAIQLAAGTWAVTFNGITTSVEVRDQSMLQLATGSQAPIYGVRQVTVSAANDPLAERAALCSNGYTQLPAGTYYAVRTMPGGELGLDAIELGRDLGGTRNPLRAGRVPHPTYTGPGAEPLPPTVNDAPVVQAIRAQPPLAARGLRLGPHP